MLPFLYYLITLLQFMGPLAYFLAIFILAVLLRIACNRRTPSSKPSLTPDDVEQGTGGFEPISKPKAILNEQELNKVMSSVEGKMFGNEGLAELQKIVSVKSISDDPQFGEECLRAIDQTKEILTTAGFNVEVKSVPGNEGKLAPVLLAKLGNDLAKKTVLFYGHVDVVGAANNTWNPFDVTVKGGKLFGRGVADGKGPLFAATRGISAFANNNIDLPINIKFCVDVSKKIGSPGFTFIDQNEPFFSNIDMACLMEGVGEQPTIGAGSMGVLNFELKVQGGKQDLHSGIFGGAVSEAMTDLTYLLANISRTTFGVSIHGIQGAFDGHGDKTVIPYKVVEKFSVRTLPLQTESYVVAQLRRHVSELMANMTSTNEINLTCTSVIRPAQFDEDGLSLRAAEKAAKRIYGKSPNVLRLIDTVPVALPISHITNGNVVAIALGEENYSDSQESIEKSTLIKGAKMVAAFLYELTVA